MVDRLPYSEIYPPKMPMYPAGQAKNIGEVHPTKGEIELERRWLKCRASLRQWQRDYERLKVVRHQHVANMNHVSPRTMKYSYQYRF